MKKLILLFSIFLVLPLQAGTPVKEFYLDQDKPEIQSIGYPELRFVGSKGEVVVITLNDNFVLTEIDLYGSNIVCNEEEMAVTRGTSEITYKRRVRFIEYEYWPF